MSHQIVTQTGTTGQTPIPLPSPEWSAGYWDCREGRPMREGQPAAYREGYCAGRVINARVAFAWMEVQL